MRGLGTQRRGTVASLGASALFGVIFYVAGVIDASAEAIFGWRMIVTAVGSAYVVLSPARRSLLLELFALLRSRWWMPIALMLASALLGIQTWLFAWAPEHGRALDASLGYLLLPIVLVLVGAFVFRESVTRLQWLAVGLAVAAVGVKLVLGGAPSWVTAAVSLGYGLYFAIRKGLRLDHEMAFALESLLVAPAAIVLVLAVPDGLSAGASIPVLAASLAGAVAMSAYVTASRLLSMPVFGLLTYLEPVLLFGVALLLGETMRAPDFLTYGLLAVALATLSIGAFSRGGAPRVQQVHKPTRRASRTLLPAND